MPSIADLMSVVVDFPTKSSSAASSKSGQGAGGKKDANGSSTYNYLNYNVKQKYNKNKSTGNGYTGKYSKKGGGYYGNDDEQGEDPYDSFRPARQIINEVRYRSIQNRDEKDTFMSINIDR